MSPTLALAQIPIPAGLPITTFSSVSSIHDIAPPLSLQCPGEIPVAHQGDSTVSNYPLKFNPNFSPQHLPSSLQRSTFLTDIRSCTPDYSPPASPLHTRAPSETTIDLCFPLTNRRVTPALQSPPGKRLIAFPCSDRLTDPILTVPSESPLYPEDPNNAPSPLSAVIPEHESIDLTTDDHVASPSPLGSPPSALELGLENCAFPSPLSAVMRSHITSLHTILAQRAPQPPFSFPSAISLTPSPPLDDVTNQGSEQEQEERRRTPTPASDHEQEGRQEREDTPLSYIVSETTQEEMRSTSGDSFVLSTTSPFLQPSSKISFVTSSIAYQVATRQKSVLPLISASSNAETCGETGVADEGAEGERLPTPSVHEPDPIVLETPRGLLGEETSFYASVRKKRIFRKDELAGPEAQSNSPIRSCVPLLALTDNEEGVEGAEGPMRWAPNSKRPMVARVVADSDSDSEEYGSTSESTLLEQERRRRRRRRRQPPLVQCSSPSVESEESEGEDVATALGSTAAAPIVLDSDPETEVDVHPMCSPSVISLSSGDEAGEEEAEVSAELPVTIFERDQPLGGAVPAPRGRFLCVEVPTLRQLERARAKAAGKLARNWTGKVNSRQTSWVLRVASQTGSSPRKPRVLSSSSSSSSSSDELNWDGQDEEEREEDGGGLVTAPDYTQCPQRTHTERFEDAKALMDMDVPPLSRPPPHTSPKKRKWKRMDTDGEGDTDGLDEWVPERVPRTRVVPDTHPNSATGDTTLHPTPSIKRPRMINRGGPIVVQFQCTIPGASFARPPLEPFRTSVAQANASINASTIHAPRFTSRGGGGGGTGCSFGCHNCRSSTDRNVKIRCSNVDRDTGGQCMHHWCERCLVLWYGFDGRGLLSAYAFSGEELGPKEIKALGERGTDGGVGLGLGIVPGKWICPNCLGKCMCTYCTKKGNRSRSRFKNDTVGVPLNLDRLEGLQVAPGLRGIRPKEKRRQCAAPLTSPTQSITPSVVSVAGFRTRNGECSTSHSTTAPTAAAAAAAAALVTTATARRPRITRELQDLLTPEFGHAMHVNGHGEFQIYKQDAAGNVVCVGVPTRMRTRACPDGAPESMGGVMGVSATELYKPVFLPGERERWRRQVGLGDLSSGPSSSPGSDGEVDDDDDADRRRSVLGEGDGDGDGDGGGASEGLPRRGNFVNVPWGAKLPQAQKRVNVVVQPEEGRIPPNEDQASSGRVESRGNNVDVEPGLTRSQFDISSVFNFGESEAGADADAGNGDVDLQGELLQFTSTEGVDTDLYTMEMEPVDFQVPSTGSVALAFPYPVLDLMPAHQESQESQDQAWGGSWETMALEFGDPSFDPLPSCGPLTTAVRPPVPPCSSSVVNNAYE
jgi:hypothetical protein